MEGRGYLELLRLPRVQSEGTHFGQVDPEAPATTAGQPGGGRRRSGRTGPGSPVNSRALDAHGHSQVDGGPTRLRLPAVAALPVPPAAKSHALHRLSRRRGAGGSIPSGQEGRGIFDL